jgi:hypothetical protein
MSPFRYPDETRLPEASRVSEVAITRFDGIYEVDPELMTEHVTQQRFPAWDTLRIARARHDHLAWMHRHWAGTVLSGEALLREAAPSETSGPTQKATVRRP